MKNRIAMILGVLVCLGLAIGLVSVKRQADAQHSEDAVKVASFSNQLVSLNRQWEDQKSVTAMLYKDLDNQKKSFTELSNNYAKASSDLAQATSDLAKTQEAVKARDEQIAERDTKIGTLEARNDALDKQAVDLSNQITNLNTQIAETRRKLTAAEGDKTFLETELKRMIAEKTDLERQFNDLAVLRQQIHKLKEELAMSRRLDWMRRGIYAQAEEHGAQRLLELSTPMAQAHQRRPSYDLNVEVNADGTVHIIPPATNRPAAPTVVK